MDDKLTSKNITIVIVMSALLLGLSALAGVIYGYLLRPRYGDRYANLFFMISFVLIFASVLYLYHVWVESYVKREDGS
jgi:hypothetical protein